MKSKDELILDILERVHDKVELLGTDVQSLKVEQVRHFEMHKTNAANLEQHMSRTEANENRLELLEKDAQFFRNFIKFVTISGALLLFGLKVSSYLLSQ
jgi:hypothetical protein